MAAAPDPAARSPWEAWRTSHAPPPVDLAPLTGRELDVWFRGGEPEADACEALLVWAGRARGALDVAIAEGLDALRQGERLAELGYHLDDYAREVLDLRKRAAQRETLDEALALAGELLPGATRAERLEAIAQEFAGAYAGEADPDQARVLGAAVRQLRPGDDARAAALEEETERWAALPAIPDVAAPDVRFYETATAHDVDARLRELAVQRAEWEDLIGYCALAVRKSQLHRLRMRAWGKLAAPLALRIAAVLAAAVQAVRDRTGKPLPLGTCLAVLAQHFLDTWKGVVKRNRSRSRKVRDRDAGHCQVPGCSHRAVDSHHVLFRSQGGGDELDNQIGLCRFHHLRCIHGGYLRVVGRAPDGLRWFLGGRPCSGPRAAAAPWEADRAHG
ncbi:HNH endonuclease [Anaeromyxobacter diazotrophicus]|uniref:HNH nuclease domain-containing protein n=1 Tax=Anaeromyxobacter diazotrophicus TaxID=2590199 RepID=A0A7I9VSS5_9BACT|nr:HNH endonuclease signature motif containing protein [Anaeromyxobacter diazotrophicus]GEJ59492.1 hypothetical protein AMYX_42330 [Anaeromyxobacter diazotrophicus]